jgi:CheY-like chemotaxis protein
MARILIIDDNSEFRFMLRALLEGAGHQVAEAGNGNEGIRCFHGDPCDLICCDLFMPEKEGLETIRELCHDFPTVKIVAMSGGGGTDGSVDMLPIARYFGAVEVLQKPFEPDTLLRILEGLLPRPQC